MKAASGLQALDAGKTVEAGIKSHDPADSAPLHDGKVNGVARRQALVAQNYLLRALDKRLLDWQDIIHDSQKRIECGLDGIPTAYGSITMEYLLEDFRIGDQSFSFCKALFDKLPAIHFVLMERADQVHGDIGIDKNHDSSPLR